jgi:hypothetical protein
MMDSVTLLLLGAGHPAGALATAVVSRARARLLAAAAALSDGAGAEILIRLGHSNFGR